MKTSAAKGAASIKQELKQAFPGVKFSVKSQNFAGGDAIDISWEFGPTSEAVQKICDKYSEGSFDGMQDLYEYNASPELRKFQEEHGSAKYIHAQRHVPETVHDAYNRDVDALAHPFELSRFSEHRPSFYAVSAKATFPTAFVYHGIEYVSGEIRVIGAIYK